MDRQSGAEGLVEYILKVSRQKENKRFYVLIIQGFLAGLFIAIGAIACLKVSSSITPLGLGSFLGALVFPLGIIAIVFMPVELFTSDCLIVTSVYAGRTKALKTAGVLCLVFVANVLGALFAAFLTKLSGIFDSATADLLVAKALPKAQMPVVRLFTSSILCNIIVCTGVCLAFNCKEEIAKIFVLWLSIAVFVISGTEHVVANMYFLLASLFYGSQIAAVDVLYSLVVSGIGNFVGGGIIVAGMNYLVVGRQSN